MIQTNNRNSSLLAAFIGSVIGSGMLTLVSCSFFISIGSIAHQIFTLNEFAMLIQWIASTFFIIVLFCYFKCNLMMYRAWRDSAIINPSKQSDKTTFWRSCINGVVYSVHNFFVPLRMIGKIIN